MPRPTFHRSTDRRTAIRRCSGLIALLAFAALWPGAVGAEAPRQAPLARIAAPVDGDPARCRQGECAMGNLIAEAMRAQALADPSGVESPSIVVALFPADAVGGTLAAGPVTLADLRAVLPAEARLARFEVTGAALLAALEAGARQAGTGHLLQVAGLRYSLDPARPPGERVAEVRLWRPEGTVLVRHGNDWTRMHQSARWLHLDPAARYAVVATAALRRAAGFEMLAGEAATGDGLLLDAVATYLRTQPPPPLDGRIFRR